MSPVVYLARKEFATFTKAHFVVNATKVSGRYYFSLIDAFL